MGSWGCGQHWCLKGQSHTSLSHRCPGIMVENEEKKTCTQAHQHADTHTLTHAHTHKHTHTHTDTDTDTYTYINPVHTSQSKVIEQNSVCSTSQGDALNTTLILTCITHHTTTHTHTHTHAHTHNHTHSHIHTHTHIHIHS